MWTQENSDVLSYVQSFSLKNERSSGTSSFHNKRWLRLRSMLSQLTGEDARHRKVENQPQFHQKSGSHTPIIYWYYPLWL